MPNFRGELIERRPNRELIAWMIVFPLVGATMVGFGCYIAWERGRELSVADWLFQVVWLLVCGTVIGIGLPAVAMKELRRRRG